MLVLLFLQLVLIAINRSESGKPFWSFLGVPYGEADRFKRPQPAKKWDGVFKADRYIECLQVRDKCFSSNLQMCLNVIKHLCFSQMILACLAPPPALKTASFSTSMCQGRRTRTAKTRNWRDFLYW